MEQKRLPIFAERFAELRGDITQGEFAELLGISRPTVGFYESGARLPDAFVLHQIAEKCHVSADWLLGFSNFITVTDKKEAEKLYSKLMDLMALEFDACDKKRVTRAIMTVLDGFKSALGNYYIYSLYENAILLVSLSLATTAECANFAQYEAISARTQDFKNELFKKLDGIMVDASVTAYKELGYFFRATHNELLNKLNANDFRSHDFGFSGKLKSVKEQLGLD